MELKITCNKKIEINNLNSIEKVDVLINDYDFKDNVLCGNVKINVNYLTAENILQEINILEPFTLYFNNEDYEVTLINISDLKYFDIVNYGIECSFYIVINYQFKVENNVEEDEESEIITQKYDKLLENIFENRDERRLIKNESINNIKFTQFKDTKSTIRIYFIESEKDIDKICNLEKISLNTLYNNSLNKDIINTKRIII